MPARPTASTLRKLTLEIASLNHSLYIQSMARQEADHARLLAEQETTTKQEQIVALHDALTTVRTHLRETTDTLTQTTSVAAKASLRSDAFSLLIARERRSLVAISPVVEAALRSLLALPEMIDLLAATIITAETKTRTRIPDQPQSVPLSTDSVPLSTDSVPPSTETPDPAL